MAAGVARGLQNRSGALTRPGWVRFPHVPAISFTVLFLLVLVVSTPAAGQVPEVTGDSTVVRPEEVASDSGPPVSPLSALVRSLVIPGWGQTAVDKPTRGAVYFAAASASMYMVFKSQGSLNAARRADPPDETLVEARKGQREDWIVLYGFIAFVSALDAWVSTQFWDFQPEITAPEEGTVSLAVRFPLAIP